MDEKWRRVSLVDLAIYVAACGVLSSFQRPDSNGRGGIGPGGILGIFFVGLLLASLPVLAVQFLRGRRRRPSEHEWAWIVANLGVIAAFAIVRFKPDLLRVVVMIWGLPQIGIAFLFQSGRWEQAGDAAEPPPDPDVIWTDTVGSVVGPLLAAFFLIAGLVTMLTRR